jgi:hypothetical protein
MKQEGPDDRGAGPEQVGPLAARRVKHRLPKFVAARHPCARVTAQEHPHPCRSICGTPRTRARTEAGAGTLKYPDLLFTRRRDAGDRLPLCAVATGTPEGSQAVVSSRTARSQCASSSRSPSSRWMKYASSAISIVIRPRRLGLGLSRARPLRDGPWSCRSSRSSSVSLQCVVCSYSLRGRVRRAGHQAPPSHEAPVAPATGNQNPGGDAAQHQPGSHPRLASDAHLCDIDWLGGGRLRTGGWALDADGAVAVPDQGIDAQGSGGAVGPGAAVVDEPVVAVWAGDG